jgi:hypothetical protein
MISNMRKTLPTEPPGAYLPEVRAALDAFRHIVQALRVGRAGEEHTTLGSAQLFALQQIPSIPVRRSTMSPRGPSRIKALFRL